MAPVIWMTGLVAIFIGTFILNKRTPIPESCKNIVDEVSCSGCSQISCGHHPVQAEGNK